MPIKSDLPLKARPFAPGPAWSWTGFYGGINGGYSVASDHFSQGFVGNVNNPSILSEASSFNSTITPKGGFLGLQGGYNYQTGPIVWGVEGDWQWANQSARSCGLNCGFTQTPDNVGIFIYGASGGQAFSVDQKVNWFGTARGRIGWTPSDGTMLYATAGGAWMGIDETDTVASIAPTPSTTTASFSNTKSGYAAGGGAEFRLWGNWTGKVEYLHIDVGGTTSTGGPNTFVVTTTTGRIKDDIVRLGVNYKLGDLASVLTR